MPVLHRISGDSRKKCLTEMGYCGDVIIYWLRKDGSLNLGRGDFISTRYNLATITARRIATATDKDLIVVRGRAPASMLFEARENGWLDYVGEGTTGMEVYRAKPRMPGM